jgi:hypothetical protein
MGVDLRIVFEMQQSKGFLAAPQIVTIVNSPLENVVDASVGKTLMGQLVLHVQSRTGQGEFRVADPARWQREIAALMASMPRGGPPPLLQHTIERQVVKVRCRHCGSLNVETDRVCATCRAPL